MRIAQVAPLAEAVPPSLYGGTERVVSWLTEELVKRGSGQLAALASGNSETSANLVPAFPEGCGWLGFATTRPTATLGERWVRLAEV